MTDEKHKVIEVAVTEITVDLDDDVANTLDYLAKATGLTVDKIVESSLVSQLVKNAMELRPRG